ncbi:MAG: dehydrogenase [Phycisphaerae bacterium]
MSHLSRRGFLKGSMAVAGGSLLVRPTRSFGALGANERIRVAVAGINGRGQSHINAFSGMKDVEVAYIVDPDSRLFGHNIKKIEDRQKKAPKAVQDIREILDAKDLDVVSIATPNHWHSLMTIWACQAGKDVYVEKPMSHNIREGRVAVDAARRYKRIVQHGTQSRSSRGHAKVVAAIASGELGKLLVSRGLCYKSGTPGNLNTRSGIGFKTPTDPPRELDFNVWLGPAPEQPYHENLVHYRWHWFWDFGNGDIGNQGVHEMDKARWGIPGATFPKSVISLGGRFGPRDQAEVADTQIALFDYGDTQLIFEVRGLPKTGNYHGVGGASNLYHLEKGTIRDGKFFPKGSDKSENLPDVEVAERPGGGDNFRNFIEAVKSRKQEDLNAEILDGHYSSALCHLANASYRLGKPVPFDRKTKAFGDNKEAYDALERMADHLKDNGLKLEDKYYQLGPKLTVDPKTGLTGDKLADEILEGTYRKPFALPESLT